MRFIFKWAIIAASCLYGVGTQFLTIPMTASDLALGMNPLLNQNGLWNPALLETSSYPSVISFSRGDGFGGLDLTHLSYCDEKGKFNRGFHIRYTGLNDLELRENKPGKNPLDYYTAGGLAIDAMVSYHSNENRFGASFRYIDMSIFLEKSRGFAMDFGYWRPFRDNGKFGFSILNIGKVDAFLSEEPTLPTRILSGLSWSIKKKAINSTLFSNIEYALLSNSSFLQVGNETRWKNILFQSSALLSSANQSASIGLGWVKGKYGFNYAMQFGSQQIGTPHLFDFYIHLP